jgi:hypothetical protein
MSKLDAELKRLERRGAGLFRRAIAGDLATFDAFLENVDRLILLWPRIRRRAVSGGGPRQAEVMRGSHREALGGAVQANQPARLPAAAGAHRRGQAAEEIAAEIG